jgi:trehalose/maltose hydrolase-like predicted phosphorylase
MYPGANEGGLTDNAYTNIMVSWMFRRVNGLLEKMSDPAKAALFEKIGLKEEELTRWDDIRQNLRLVISGDGIISQYDGYFDLKELDWNHYRNKYGNIYRMDRLLKAEGKSADDYKVAKQADMLMTFYNLDKEQVDHILEEMGYTLPEDYLEKNLRYYLARTSHGSTLSRVVHAQLANIIGDEQLSWDLYFDALTSDYNDIQGGTTAEGIHTGVMAGTIMIAITTFAGIDLRGDVLKITPALPERWKKMTFNLRFKGVVYQFDISTGMIKISADKETVISFRDKKVKVGKNAVVINF